MIEEDVHLHRNDPNLGAFYYWFEALARKTDSLVVLANRIGDVDLPPHVQTRSFGGKRRGGRLGRVWKFWELFSRYFADADAVLFHQIPEFVIAASPFLIGRGKIIRRQDSAIECIGNRVHPATVKVVVVIR